MWSNENLIWRIKSSNATKSDVRKNEAKRNAHFLFPRLHTNKEAVRRAAEQQGETKQNSEWVAQVPHKNFF